MEATYLIPDNEFPMRVAELGRDYMSKKPERLGDAPIEAALWFDRMRDRRSLKLTHFESIVGTTYVVSDGYCVLGYFKTRAAARQFRRASMSGMNADVR